MSPQNIRDITNMPISPFTPRSSPGQVPSADVEQFYLEEDLIKIAGFISGASPGLLYDIMSAASEADLRLLLASVNPLEERFWANEPMIATCMRISSWLQTCNETHAISKDVIPYALFLLLKVKVLNRARSDTRTHNDSIRFGVAVKIAYGNLCDGIIWPRTLEYLLCTPFHHIQATELRFLKDMDWRTWVREADFKEFSGRFEVVWEMLLDDDDETPELNGQN